MQLVFLDWIFIIGYLIAAFAIGVWYFRRASTSIEEFFVADRSLPWWIAGTSIIAARFSADTPLAVSGMVRRYGIYQNWYWWCNLLGVMLCVFFFAKLWRRSQVITDAEFIELRYKGKAAAALRGFKAVYIGLLANSLTIGFVMLAMAKISGEALGWSKAQSVALLAIIALVYTVMSGAWGVVMTDLIQLVMSLVGSVGLACIVMWKMGGPVELVEKVANMPNARPEVMHFVPDFSHAEFLTILTFFVYICVLWWGEGQGATHVAQRLFSTKNEKHASLAMMWYGFGHYVLRPWPWIIVGLASLYYYPFNKGENSEAVYATMIVDFLPAGLRGIMIASLLAAFMSTIDTHLNLGASYLINDVYKRFLCPDKSARHYVNASRLAMVALLALGSFAAWQMDTIFGAWKYIASLGAGALLIYLMRWYWWRINAWAEIAALTTSLLMSNGLLLCAKYIASYLMHRYWREIAWSEISTLTIPLMMPKLQNNMFGVRYLIIVLSGTMVWVLVTLLTSTKPGKHLQEFYRRVRPGGWWGPVAALCSDVTPAKSATGGWIGWLSGVVCIYSGVFGVGYLCTGRAMPGISFLALGVVAGVVLFIRAPAIWKDS